MGFADPFFNLLVFLQNFLGLYFPEDHCPVCPGEGIKVLSFIRVYTCSSFTEFTQYCGIWLKITLIHFLPYVLLSQFCKSQPHGPSCFSPHGRIPAIPLSPHEAVASSQLLPFSVSFPSLPFTVTDEAQPPLPRMPNPSLAFLTTATRQTGNSMEW